MSLDRKSPVHIFLFTYLSLILYLIINQKHYAQSKVISNLEDNVYSVFSQDLTRRVARLLRSAQETAATVRATMAAVLMGSHLPRDQGMQDVMT